MLAFLAEPDLPRPPPEHWGFFVSRSRWFDLLVPADRVEAMRGIWGVMAYMMRDTTTANPETMAFARRLAKTGTLAQAAEAARTSAASSATASKNAAGAASVAGAVGAAHVGATSGKVATNAVKVGATATGTASPANAASPDRPGSQ